jgi:hypothetical protein
MTITAIITIMAALMSGFLGIIIGVCIKSGSCSDAERHSAILSQAVKHFLIDCDQAAYEGRPETFQAITPQTLQYGQQALEAYQTFNKSE